VDIEVPGKMRPQGSIVVRTARLTYRVSKNGRHQTPALVQMGNDVVDEAP